MNPIQHYNQSLKPAVVLTSEEPCTSDTLNLT